MDAVPLAPIVRVYAFDELHMVILYRVNLLEHTAAGSSQTASKCVAFHAFTLQIVESFCSWQNRPRRPTCMLQTDVCVLQAMQSRLEEAQQGKNKGGMSGQAEEELEALRGLLRCNVCHERQKDVIITKCMHMFCKPCIQRNLDARHRKCPGCGAAFGNKDVQQFFFT